MLDKPTLSVITVILTMVAFYPYVVAIRRRSIQPHVFSWIIWAMSTVLVFFAQLSDGGGVGAWPTGLSGVITVYIAVLAYRYRQHIQIVPSDWACLGIAVLAIGLWYWTETPLWAVILITGIDLAGFVPTLHKAYAHPFSENLTMYGLMVVRNGVSMLALEQYSTITLLFPGAMSIAIVGLIAIVAYQRMRHAVIRRS